MGGHKAKDQQEVVDELRREFVDETVETLQSLDMELDAARNGRADAGGVVDRFRRLAIGLRGQAANFGLRPLGAVAHRLSDYLAEIPKVLPPRVWGDLQAYLDLMLALAEGRQPEDAAAAGLVRTLPPRLGFDLGDIQVRNVEVLLVMPHGAQTKYVERELQQCGYRVSMISETIEAFALILDTMPDLVIVSAIMPRLDGLDLAIALAAMPATRNIPIAVITSLEPGDDQLKLLPKRIPVLHKGPSFGDDLFKALDSLFLI